MARVPLFVCKGSHCRKLRSKNLRLQRTLGALPVDVTHVGCQKVCRGPVVGIAIDARLEWFERMGSRKALRALVELLETGQLASPLRKRRDRKRSGRLRS